MLKALSGLVLTAIIMSANLAQAAWVIETFYADYPTIREYHVFEPGPFRRIEMKVMDGALRVNRAEFLTPDLFHSPLFHLEGDYFESDYRWQSFRPQGVRALRMSVQSLTPGRPVTVKISVE